MNPFLLTYDLKSSYPDPHSWFLRHAQMQGLSSWIEADGEMCQLPNTTLMGTFPSRTAAVAAFDRALANTEREIGVKVTMSARYVVQQGGQGLIDPKAKRPKVDLATLFARSFGLQRMGPGTRLLSR